MRSFFRDHWATERIERPVHACIAFSSMGRSSHPAAQTAHSSWFAFEAARPMRKSMPRLGVFTGKLGVRRRSFALLECVISCGMVAKSLSHHRTPATMTWKYRHDAFRWFQKWCEMEFATIHSMAGCGGFLVCDEYMPHVAHLHRTTAPLYATCCS